MVKKYCLKFLFLGSIFIIASFNIYAQTKPEQGLLNASEKFNSKRFKAVLVSEGAVGVLITTGLEYLWYKKFPHSRFHFFNDNNEWLNMDKVGHATTAYNVSAMQYNLMRWSGVKTKKASWIGGLTGLAYLTMIEIFDGFSQKWGFSKGDMLANIAGSTLFVAQQSSWGQQKIQLRFSYHNSIFAQYNPEELGKKFSQKLFKDYNGQSYWLSFNISSFLNDKNNFPKWINTDIGYGAEGMTGAVLNPSVLNGKAIPQFTRQRKFYFSFDGAFTKNNSCYPGWINIFHMPAPAIELKLKTKEIKEHLFYF